MIPRLAALSIAEISARICSGLGVCVERTAFCIVRRRVTTLRLWSDRFTVCRARLAADFVLAIVINTLWTCTLASELRLSILKVFEVWIHAGRRAVTYLRPIREPGGYKRLFDSSFAFRRSAASAPAIRICSTESVAASVDVEPV